MSILQISVTDLSKLSDSQIATSVKIEAATIRAAQRDSKVVSQSGDRRGQLEQTTETVDGNGKFIGKQQVKWTYYPEGNVDSIIITETDATGKVIDSKVIKHNVSGVTGSPVTVPVTPVVGVV